MAIGDCRGEIKHNRERESEMGRRRLRAGDYCRHWDNLLLRVWQQVAPLAMAHCRHALCNAPKKTYYNVHKHCS